MNDLSIAPDAQDPRLQPGKPSAGSRIDFHLALRIAGTLMVVVTASVQLYDILRRLDIVVETAEQSYASLSRTLAEQTRSAAQAVDVVVQDTATVMQMTRLRADDPQIHERLRGRMRLIPHIENLFVAGRDGRVLATGADATLPREWVALQPFFLAHRQQTGSGLFISQAFRSEGAANWAIALSRRINDAGGRFQGVAVAWVDLDYFRRFYQAIDLGEGSEVVLFRQGGGLLARYPSAGDELSRPFAEEALFRSLLAGQHKTATLLQSPADGQERIYAAQAVGGYPLAVGVSVKKTAVLDAWHVQVIHSTVRTTLLCLSVIALVWLVLRHLRRSERAEEQLRVQTALLDELFESAPEAIVMLDLDQRVTRVNREFTRMFGYTAEQVRGRALDTLIVPEELRPEWQRLARSVRHGRHTSMETERIRNDGLRLHVSELGAPILVATGQIASYAIYRDISERRLADAERDKLETRLRQAVKLEAIGTMAGGIAHDFNNILAAILGYGDMAKNAAPEGSILKRYVGNVLAAAHRAKALIDQILTYSRSTRGQRTVVNVDEVVEETLELVRVSLPKDIELSAPPVARRAAVIADPTHIHQLIMNLCRNAVHAMGAGGRLTVALDVIDEHEDATLSHGLLPAGRYVRLRVEDTGCGMTPEVAARIFEPFFTTRESGTGTGLGLALVQGIVTDLGGAIDVASRPRQGSTFDIYLPRSDAEAIEKADHAAPLPRGHGERVLLVEDEKPLMLLTEEMLAALNYEPAGFTRPSEALEEFRTDPSRFDAVVLDHLMPGMTGTELARQMRQLRADVPVVLISGYTGPVLTQQALSAGIDHILTKPLDLRQIADAISKVLAREFVR
ncbi:MAG: PAS domain S-box protein [Betaproteobacteria bacterium]|nr:PAS domain S-box protein [Betaproteobacteria bacterium]